MPLIRDDALHLLRAFDLTEGKEDAMKWTLK
jgi:hypothetical protein